MSKQLAKQQGQTITNVPRYPNQQGTTSPRPNCNKTMNRPTNNNSKHNDVNDPETESKKISSKQLKELKKTFQMFDQDGNGKISASELAHAFRIQGQNIPDAEIRNIIREVDDDGNGQIDFEEFVSLMTTKTQEARQQMTRDESELREAFNVFDQNGDGKISCKELKCVLNSIGEKMSEREFAELIREADTDGDGSISFEEFSKVLAHKFM